MLCYAGWEEKDRYSGQHRNSVSEGGSSYVQLEVSRGLSGESENNDLFYIIFSLMWKG